MENHPLNSTPPPSSSTNDYRSLLRDARTSVVVDEDDGCCPSAWECCVRRSPDPTVPRWRGWCQCEIDYEALYFGMRMSLLLTIGSLFVLIETEEGKFPQGLWVLITILFISWFPTRDAASVIEKSSQRLMGTLVGAALGLTCGFLSLLMPDQKWQAIFLGLSVMIVTFFVVFLSGQLSISEGKRVMKKYSYATILCLLTFSIALMPFYSEAEPKWRKGVWRIINVIIGCIIGAIGSVAFWPRSTTSILRGQISKQVGLAGESSEAVLHAAADAYSGFLNPLGLADELLETRKSRRTRLRMSFLRKSHRNVSKSAIKEDGDLVLEKYGKAINDWKATKALIPLIPWDPLKFRLSEDDMSRFQLKAARILAQTLRIQTLTVVLDGIIRNDSHVEFEEDQVDLLAQVGTLIRTMLSVPLNEGTGNPAAAELAMKLNETRKYIREVASTVSQGEEAGGGAATSQNGHHLYAAVFESISQGSDRTSACGSDHDGSGHGLKRYDTTDLPCTASAVLLFLELVEQLVLRSLRLYHTWKGAEGQMKEIFPRDA